MKSVITEAAAKAVVVSVLPINFCYQKAGFVGIVRALIEIGHGLPQGEQVNVYDALPCASTVCNKIKDIAQERRSILKGNMKAMICAGGGISCNGVQVEATGKKYYDFLIHYLYVQVYGNGSIVKKWKLSPQVLFMLAHNKGESEADIRAAINSKLTAQYSISLDEFKSNFTFVTDCALTMVCVFGASVSANRVPFGEK